MSDGPVPKHVIQAENDRLRGEVERLTRNWSEAITANSNLASIHFEEEASLRRALDAALAVQGCPKLPGCKTYADRAYADGRAEALEEAAKVAETNAESDLAYGRRYPDEYHKMEQRAHRGRTIAAAIRALKETK